MRTKHFIYLVISLVIMTSLTSCNKTDQTKNYNHVILFYNQELVTPMGYLPSNTSDDIVLSIVPDGIYRYYSVNNDEFIKESILDINMSLPVDGDYSNLKRALQTIQDKYPSKCYDMVLNLWGATYLGGWLPASFASYGDNLLDLERFADNCPLYFRSITLMGEHMGCIENAYSVRSICNHLISESTIGHYYLSSTYIVQDLIKTNLDTYWERIGRNLTGSTDMYAVSMIDCTKVNEFADVFKDVYKKNKANINVNSIKENALRLSEDSVFTPYELFDLKDMLSKAGIDEDNMKDITRLLQAMVEKQHSSIDNYCGLAMCNPLTLDKSFTDFYYLKGWHKKTSWGK